MDRDIRTNETLDAYRDYLQMEEKSQYTVEKYLRDARTFMDYAEGRAITKELAIDYKNELIAKGYAVSSVNSMLASLRSLLHFLGLDGCRVRSLKTQRQVFCPEEKELTREEYFRLLAAAEGQPRLQLILETVCATGIRISELKYFTVEAAKEGEVRVSCKNKIRTVLLPKKLRRKLLSYAADTGVKAGVLFCTRSGKALDRSNIWTAMKKLCEKAGVLPSKVFPHNLRKLFARCFYEIKKDIAKLADILGHSSVNTTRIYLMSSGGEHRRCIERLNLLI